MMNPKAEQLLRLVVANKASDLHLVAGVWPKMRVDGQLSEITTLGEIGAKEMEEIVASILTEEQRAAVTKERDLDFSLDTGFARFRANVYFQRGSLSAALRIVSAQIPNLKDLHLPDVFLSLASLKQGFILV